MHLGRLTLRVQLLVTHEAVTTGDVERHDHPVTGADVPHLAPDRLDDPHGLVAEDVTLVDEPAQHLVQVKVGPTDPAGGDPHDGVGRLLDGGIGNGVDSDVALGMPGECFHARVLPHCLAKYDRAPNSVVAHHQSSAGAPTRPPGIRTIRGTIAA